MFCLYEDKFSSVPWVFFPRSIFSLVLIQRNSARWARCKSATDLRGVYNGIHVSYYRAYAPGYVCKHCTTLRSGPRSRTGSCRSELTNRARHVSSIDYTVVRIRVYRDRSPRSLEPMQIQDYYDLITRSILALFLLVQSMIPHAPGSFISNYIYPLETTLECEFV